jgi:hypothetical protein
MLLADGNQRATRCYRDVFDARTAYVVNWEMDVRIDQDLAGPVGLRLAHGGHPVVAGLWDLHPRLLHQAC